MSLRTRTENTMLHIDTQMNGILRLAGRSLPSIKDALSIALSVLFTFAAGTTKEIKGK